MSYIVGDHAVINKGTYRTGRKNYLVKIVSIDKTIVDTYSNGTENVRTVCKIQTQCNADTGKKYKKTMEWTVEGLHSLEEFLDTKRALIKELEGFLI